MKIHKQVIGHLYKCYSMTSLDYNRRKYILVASEKNDKCLMFDEYGNLKETIWDQPGGVMSMVQWPNTNGIFLSTQKFYSPNDSINSEIVVVTPDENNNWKVNTFIKMPHIHRFDLIQYKGNIHLIICTLKSDHKYKDDWSTSGKVYSAILPNNIDKSNIEYNIKLKEIKEDKLFKNHGYYRINQNGIPSSLISSDNGIYLFQPPECKDDNWHIKQILDLPTSDCVLLDIDNDGKEELITISPFHGNEISIFKNYDGKFKKIYQYEKPLEFSHAIFGGMLWGKQSVIIGHRDGNKDIIRFTFDNETNNYVTETIDKNVGSTNVFKFVRNNKDILVSCNREINEIAMYSTI